jgi:molybdopterin synthase sulfur carrier subunit
VIQIRLRYFASIREALGEAEVVVMPEPCTVAAVRDHLIASSDAHAHALARGRALRSAVNQTMCDEQTPVADGAELAFFPPVTGG